MAGENKMTYAGVGVDYGAMDPFKRMAQIAAAGTDQLASRFGFRVVEWTRGESVFVMRTPLGDIGFVVEGLGTKNRVADAMYKIAKATGHESASSFYHNVAQCNVAMAVNDMITLGVMPVCYGQYVAAGDSRWFEDEQRARDLVEGTKQACQMAGCVWGGGETPTLKTIVEPDAVDLAGATWGYAPSGQLINPQRIRAGDVIVMFGSSGIHANGLTMARAIAEKLPDGYLTELPDGRTYGEALLDPTVIYVKLIDKLIKVGVDIHYAVNITGHGWRKLMRAPQPFQYVIETLPPRPPIFDFIREHGPMAKEQAYGNLNMGAGFAIFVGARDTHYVKEALKHLRMKGFEYSATFAGEIRDAKEKSVVIAPENITFGGDTLAVR